MRHLHDALPASRRGSHAADADAIAPLVQAALHQGDLVLVKGSAGSRMGRVVKAIEQAAPLQSASGKE
jgi:UDP-N-acetylmuramoyl-tripeptide--D-alanyl-D-alanine ligase